MKVKLLLRSGFTFYVLLQKALLVILVKFLDVFFSDLTLKNVLVDFVMSVVEDHHEGQIGIFE